MPRKTMEAVTSPSPSTTASSDGSQEEEVTTLQTKKRRVTPKEQTEALQSEYEALLRRLQEIQATQHAAKTHKYQRTQTYELLRRGVTESELVIAGAQSILSSRHINPLKAFIHLPADPAERRAYLEAMRPIRKEQAMTFMEERVRFLNLRRPHRQVDACETDEGDYVVTFFDIVPFTDPDVETSVLQVYNHVIDFFLHQEFKVTEHAEMSTLCETDDNIVPGHIAQSRFLSTTSDGVDVEKNAVTFQYCPGQFAPLFSKAMTIRDSVDVDEVYSYKPEQRMRNDITAVTIIWETPPTHPDEKPVIAVVRWASVRMYRPLCGITRDQELSARETTVRWSEALGRSLREATSRLRRIPNNLS
ncbi:hypothetical protein Poli38472_012336 [Pythium oligandrum]|uniref:Uncharacterized protein n=1 Tax=Pythium oligandrum TaxID=41045 RepID=A0A8K1CR56_PYTOL|nr:hypothetical protein Poli38472_012336 [Pythium oligandrum]|eukprot:TMW67220.1 hypothetical protein Poli38472_012336 [Pythium oligandrum]